VYRVTRATMHTFGKLLCRSTIFALLIFYLLNTSCKGQEPQPSQPNQQPNPAPPQPIPWAQHYRTSTVSLGRIVTVDNKKSFEALGTGVLIAKQTSITTYVAVATAKHVIDDSSSNWHPLTLQVRFASEESKPLNEDYGYEIQLSNRLGQPVWKGADDGSDVAIIPISTAIFWPRLKDKAITDAIGIQDLGHDEELFEGESITIFGFPGDVSVLMGPNALVRAVTRSGIVSWIDPFINDGAFMIDANILPGNSGGPVFKTPGGSDKYGNLNIGGTAHLLGIVTSTIGNEYVRSVGGLGRVERASKIRTLFLSILPLPDRN
jgi:hypothetical protein